MTIMFLDIRSFTAFAERADPAQVVETLNGLFAAVVPVLARHGGHANKFLGAGVLGVFGAPERHSDHADRAVAAALEIAVLVRARHGEGLRVGIGLNSGPVVAGTVGGGGRLEFAVIGDAVKHGRARRARDARHRRRPAGHRGHAGAAAPRARHLSAPSRRRAARQGAAPATVDTNSPDAGGRERAPGGGGGGRRAAREAPAERRRRAHEGCGPRGRVGAREATAGARVTATRWARAPALTPGEARSRGRVRCASPLPAERARSR